MTYKYKTEGKVRKVFSNYQNLIDLYINLKDGSIKPKKVLKNQINFRSDLGKLKKWNPKSKIENQVSVTQTVQNCLI